MLIDHLRIFFGVFILLPQTHLSALDHVLGPLEVGLSGFVVDCLEEFSEHAEEWMWEGGWYCAFSQLLLRGAPTEDHSLFLVSILAITLFSTLANLRCPWYLDTVLPLWFSWALSTFGNTPVNSPQMTQFKCPSICWQDGYTHLSPPPSHLYLPHTYFQF